MHIAIEGCAHGELETIYKCITELEAENSIKIELLICCGDFQSVRNENDLRCMAVPPKYYNMCSFYKYYSGELVAPVLTIFIGGNHEASNYLQELPFGGWVAPNIFYLGYAGVVNYKGLRIGGISGIYKGRDYSRGHFEYSPYTEDTKRSVYHIRNIEVFRLKQLEQPVDIFMSHDWPSKITNYGNVDQLLRFKPFFKDDIERGNLGSPPCDDLLFALKPKYWFSAHLHCKFAAIVPHENGTSTKFLALDKCVPRKRFLQVITVPPVEESTNDTESKLEYDLEWLTILHLTPHLSSIKNICQYMPSKTGNVQWTYTPTVPERNKVLELFEGNLTIPDNFQATAPCYKPGNISTDNIYQPDMEVNEQTTEFCAKLRITDPTEEVVKRNVNKLDKSKSHLFDEAEANQSRNSNDSHSFIEDESEIIESEDVAQTQTESKRLSLVLPEAVNQFDEADDLEADKKLDIERASVSILSTDIDGDLKVAVENKEEVKVDEDKPVIKKFKRRNASIYEQNDDNA